MEIQLCRAVNWSCLLCLADCASDPGGQCWPSISLIAKRARIDRSNVMDHLAALETDGYITVERELRKVNHYIVRSTPLVVPAPLPSGATTTSLVVPAPTEPSVNPQGTIINTHTQHSAGACGRCSGQPA